MAHKIILPTDHKTNRFHAINCKSKILDLFNKHLNRQKTTGKYVSSNNYTQNDGNNTKLSFQKLRNSKNSKHKSSFLICKFQQHI